jgi:hypothetical protein
VFLFQDSTNADKPVNEFNFSSLDLSKSVFTSEDHTKILMQADRLLHATKRQLLDLQMVTTCEEEKLKVESNPAALSFSRLVDLHYSFCMCVNVQLGNHLQFNLFITS